MYKLIFFFFLISTINGFSQSDSSMNQIGFIRNDKVEQTLDTNKISIALQGRMSDPFICNELGLGLIIGTESPNFGINIDYNPLKLKRFVGQIGYRTDFNNQIFSASLESNYWINIYPRHFLDFKFIYDRIKIDNSLLKDFQKLSFGPIYRLPWTSFGCFIGQDTYEKQLGVDIYFKYQFHKMITGSNNDYKSKFVLQSLIGIWNKKVIYDLNSNYLIHFNYSCGIGYKRIYDFEEIYVTFRYLIRY